MFLSFEKDIFLPKFPAPLVDVQWLLFLVKPYPKTTKIIWRIVYGRQRFAKAFVLFLLLMIWDYIIIITAIVELAVIINVTHGGIDIPNELTIKFFDKVFFIH